MPSDKIYRHQRVLFLALVLVTRVPSSTLPHPFPDLNPISLFGTNLHALPPTSFTAFSCSKCCKLYIGGTGRRLSDRFAEHLRSVRNNDVDKPVARHFNAANHSISDIKVCAISPISPNAQNVRLYCPYWQYTDLFIFRFVSLLCMPTQHTTFTPMYYGSRPISKREMNRLLKNYTLLNNHVG